MGTGKGSMDYWAARVPVSRVIFELKGEVHEQIVRDAFRVASAKLPGIAPPPRSSMTRHHNGVAEKRTYNRSLRDYQKGRCPMHRHHEAYTRECKKTPSTEGTTNRSIEQMAC